MNAIQDKYPLELYYPDMEMAEASHILTNTSKSKAQEVVNWLTEYWEGGFSPPAGP